MKFDAQKPWKLFFVIIIFNIILFNTEVFAASFLCVRAREANVRSGPGTEFEILWGAGRYYPFKVLEKRGGWVKVKDFEGDIGWVYSKLLFRAPCVVVYVKRANVRAAPSKKARILFCAPKGTAFKVLKRKGKWLYVEYADGDRGWIFGSLVWGKTRVR